MIGSLERTEDGSTKAGIGTGMIPADKIIATSPKAGVPGAVDGIWIRHKSGGVSMIGMKSYGKDRDSFEGTKKDIVGLDESPPQDVLDECVMRTMSTEPGKRSGIIIMTFTPLEGYTSVVKTFMESENPDRWFTQITWDDCPHLTPEVVAEMSRNYLPSQLKARSKGIPTAGEGAIYPIDIDEISVDPFVIPDTWPRGYAMDVGKTAVLFGAINPDADRLVIYDEYYSELYNPVMHAEAVKARGKWLRGVIDPGSLGSSQVDGQKLFQKYKSLGLDLETAENAVETGLTEVWLRLCSGRLQIFNTLQRFRLEFERYHRHEVETVFGIKSKPVKKDDHIMDCLRYLCMSGIQRFRVQFTPKPRSSDPFADYGSFATSGDGSWQVM
jgi:phage terminase large subunit-like protein